MYELAWRIAAVRVMLNTQVAVALVFSLLLVLWLWRRELAAVLHAKVCKYILN